MGQKEQDLQGSRRELAQSQEALQVEKRDCQAVKEKLQACQSDREKTQENLQREEEQKRTLEQRLNRMQDTLKPFFTCTSPGICSGRGEMGGSAVRDELKRGDTRGRVRGSV